MFGSLIPSAMLSILPLLLFAPLLAAIFRSRWLRALIIIAVMILIIFEAIAIYFSGGFVDYQFFVNLNLADIFAGLLIFKWQALLATVVFVLLLAVLLWLSRWFARHWPRWLCLLAAALCLGLFCRPHGPLSKLYEIYQVTMAKPIALDTALQQLQMQDYVPKSQLQALAGKNIVVISLESFEQGFMQMPQTAPNLAKLAQQYTFYAQMPMSPGSSWTTASMYTYMTGVPFLVGGFNSAPLVDAKQTALVSLGDVLHRAGYQTVYIAPHPKFAGMGHIINLFGIKVLSEDDFPNQYPQAPFGLYDRDIFDIASKQIAQFQQQSQPFALFISTISTHAPNGFADPRMQKYIHLNQDDSMQFAAASLDYNLQQFIDELKAKQLLDKTVFFIFPDHLMMGQATPTITKLAQQTRQLYVITNADAAQTGFDPAKTLYQIDLPRLILNAAQVKTNARFLTDYLPVKSDKREFIQKHKAEIAQLNQAAAKE